MSRRVITWPLVLAGSAALSSVVLAQSPALPAFYTIPSQDLGDALLQLAQTSGRNILFSPDSVRGIKSNPVSGAASFKVALHALLAGTPMVETDAADSIVIKPRRLASAAAEAAGAALSSAPDAKTDAAEIAQVTVTARKKLERLDDVPIAVTALSGSQLAADDHRRIEDLNSLVPSTNFVITNGHQSSFSVRGLGTNPGNDGLEGSTGVFLDGIYLGRPGMAAMDLIDIAQLEVLRGPQGTLFGKNTTAGAVSITTQAPSFTPGGEMQVTYGNYNYQQYQGTITGPLVDGFLAGRLTGFSTERDGDVYGVSTHHQVNDLARQGVRGQLLVTPTTDLTIRLIGEYEREQQSMGAVLIVPSWGATPEALQTKFAAVGKSFTPDPTGSTTYDDAPDRTGTRQTSATAELNWNIGDLTLTSLTGYRSWRYDSYADADGTAAAVLVGGYHVDDAQWSEELRVKLPRIGAFETMAGFFYFHQDQTVDQLTDYGADAAAWLSGISSSLLPAYASRSPALAYLMSYNDSRWDTWSKPNTDSYAVFGQSTWHVTDPWSITAGFRETYEAKAEAVWAQAPFNPQTGVPVAALASQARAPFSVAVYDAAPSFLVSSDYHFTSDLMGYLSASQSEKAGGVNTNLPAAGESPDSLKVKPETATNYEIGLKSEAFEHRLRLAVDAFYTSDRDYQATYIGIVNGSAIQQLTNVGAVHSRGAELEVTSVPVRGLTLSVNGSFNEATYASYPSGPCPQGSTTATCDLTGRPVAGAPRWVGNLDAQYDHAVSGWLAAYALAEYSWRSHYYGYIDDSANVLTGGYGLLNLRAGVHTIDGRWDLSVWGKNVTDKRYVANYLSYSTLLPGTYAAFFGDFANYGVTLRASL